MRMVILGPSLGRGLDELLERRRALRALLEEHVETKEPVRVGDVGQDRHAADRLLMRISTRGIAAEPPREHIHGLLLLVRIRSAQRAAFNGHFATEILRPEQRLVNDRLRTLSDATVNTGDPVLQNS